MQWGPSPSHARLRRYRKDSNASTPPICDVNWYKDHSQSKDRVHFTSTNIIIHFEAQITQYQHSIDTPSSSSSLQDEIIQRKYLHYTSLYSELSSAILFALRLALLLRLITADTNQHPLWVQPHSGNHFAFQRITRNSPFYSADLFYFPNTHFNTVRCFA